jgi:hypothetical protein
MLGKAANEKSKPGCFDLANKLAGEGAGTLTFDPFRDSLRKWGKGHEGAALRDPHQKRSPA